MGPYRRGGRIDAVQACTGGTGLGDGEHPLERHLGPGGGNMKTAGESSSKLGLAVRGLGGEGSAVAGTEGIIVRVGILASRADIHERW